MHRRALFSADSLSARFIYAGTAAVLFTLYCFTVRVYRAYKQLLRWNWHHRGRIGSLHPPAFLAALWLAVKDDHTGTIVATGIAELDREIGEGVLEWIQVTEGYRGKGLGRYIVSELLWRMKEKANFATVSGRCNNAANPEKLYRECGFTGSDVWHILRKDD